MGKKENKLSIIIGTLWVILFAILIEPFFKLMNTLPTSAGIIFYWSFTIIGPFLISFGAINHTNLKKTLKTILIIISTIILSILFWFILWGICGFKI